MAMWNTMAVGRIAFLLIFFAIGSVAWAEPDDDYKTGVKMYRAGDMIGAMPLVRKAADAGHAAAQAMYGDMILAGGSDDDEAAGYFRKAAEQGNAEGQFRLGAMYVSGEGVKRDIAIGRKWIVSAADQGHVLAINAMALAHMNGTMDVPPEALKSAEALRWIRLSAENDFLPAIREMVKAYRLGEYGLKADSKLADEWAAREAKVSGFVIDRRGKRSVKK